MEQLEHGRVLVCERHERRFERERVRAELRQRRLERVACEERREQRLRGVRKPRAARGRVLRQRIRNVQAAVGGEAGGDRVCEPDDGRAPARAQEAHRSILAPGAATGET